MELCRKAYTLHVKGTHSSIYIYILHLLNFFLKTSYFFNIRNAVLSANIPTICMYHRVCIQKTFLTTVAMLITADKSKPKSGSGNSGESLQSKILAPAVVSGTSASHSMETVVSNFFSPTHCTLWINE